MDPREGRSFRQSSLFGGQGEVIIRDLLEGATALPFEAALACELEPNGSVGPHRQAECHELIIVLSGEGTATIDDHVHPLRSATTLCLTHGAILALHNTSTTEPLRYLLIKAR